MKDFSKETRYRIGMQIEKRRKALGLTQMDVVKITGLTRGNVISIENGTYSSGIDNIGTVANSLGCIIELVKNGKK